MNRKSRRMDRKGRARLCVIVVRGAIAGFVRALIEMLLDSDDDG